MKDFDIVKYLKENKQGAYGVFNGYVDLKPLKEEEDNGDLDADTVPYEGADDMITGNGEDDTYEQDDVVSEAMDDDRIEGLINRTDLRNLQASVVNIFDELTDVGFDAEDVAKYLIDQINGAASAYIQNLPTSADGNEFEAPEWQKDRTQNREFYEGDETKKESAYFEDDYYEEEKAQIPSTVKKLNAIAKKFGFKMRGDVNTNPNDADSVAFWVDRNKNSAELFMGQDGLEVTWIKFIGRKPVQRGSHAPEDFFSPETWMEVFDLE